MSHFEKRVQLNKIIESQLPEFLVADFPKAVEFFKQYYLSLEHQGGNVDLIDNLDRYIKLDNLIPEVVVGKVSLTSAVSKSDTVINVSSTVGFPDEYGLLQIGDEIVTYTDKTATSFTGCVRGFSGITGYDVGISSVFSNVNKQNITFRDSAAANHDQTVVVKNLSVLFLQEFYKKLKKTFTPGLEEYDFVSDLNVGNFIKHARNFYQSKGIAESIKILFKVLYGAEATVIDLENRLIKPSSAEYIRREIVVAENISGNPFKLEGQTIFKSNDLNTNASVSDVEIFTRNQKTFYKLGLFVGYNDKDLIEGIFRIPGASRSLEPVNVNDTVISVDSTIGFGQTGTIISGNNRIDYTSKSINQFYGCTGVTSKIELNDLIREDETIFGYEDGDTENRCDMRITGVLSKFTALEDIPLMEEDELITVRNVGEVIFNPPNDKTQLQTFANSWIYNTSTRFEVDSIAGSVFTLKSDIDKSSLKEGDFVEVLIGDSQQVVVPDPTSSNSSFAQVSNINATFKEVTLSNTGTFVADPTREYSIRRKLVKSKSSGVVISVGNDVFIANALNVYTDDSQEFGYVASNSLPGYTIPSNIVESSIPDGTVSNLGDFSSYFKSYGSIKFSGPVDFRDGDEIKYTATNQLSGLVSGEYYFVKLIAQNEIRVYSSKSTLGGNEFVRIGPNNNPGVHNFTLRRHENRELSGNKVLRKFPLSQNNIKVESEERGYGNVGVLVDGVEISGPASRDKIYYGPIEEFEVLNGGRGYDVIDPPEITISTGAGLTAYVEPVVEGSVKEVFVDPQDFDFQEFLSVSLTGGNGSGCSLEPVVGQRFREISFDSRNLTLGGGIDIGNETITFTKQHNLADGQHIIYNHNGNDPISTGDPYDPNNLVTGSLAIGDEYVARVVNTSTIRLFRNDIDAFSGVTGINTIGLSTATTAAGIHKFRTLPQNNLRAIKVLNGGSGYTHRKLRVKSSGISTEYNTIYFDNHGFKTGEVVTYQTTGTEVVGLSTLNRYSIQKLTSNSFRVINVGVAGTFTSDLNRGKYVKFDSTGSGYQIFQYPEIRVDANVSFGGTTGTFSFNPVITGEIIDAYLYESGTGYGSTTLNLHKKPLINISKGKNAQVNPIISNGRIVDIQVLNKGSNYKSTPDLTIEDPSGGTGAILRPVMVDDRLDDVVVINSGIGYSSASTSIFVDPRGSGALFDTRVRVLNVNDAYRFGKISANNSTKIYSNLYKNDEENSLVYGIYGYSEDLASNFEPLNGAHSPIIGWAYDGNPIYGPFGYESSENIQSGIKRLETGYVLRTSSVVDRPSFEPGFFVEDYQYDNIGDLDHHNGRFCKTPDFPNGVYAYFAGVTTSTVSADFIPTYPYFVGNKFKSKVINENLVLDHSFDFNKEELVRNTFPYKVNDPYADYDFINESYEDFEQSTVVESVLKGDVPQIKVVDGGTGYSIGDRVNFDLEDIIGSTNVRGEVSELKGVGITSISTTLDSNSGCVFVWDTDDQVSAYQLKGFDFNNNDTVLVSGLSTSVTYLAGSKKIGFSTETVGLAGTMTSYSSLPGGKTEDIFVSRLFNTVSIGNSITIVSSSGNEVVTVLNNFSNGVLRVKRYGSTGAAHSFGSDLNLTADRVKLPVKTGRFTSQRDNLVYFNAAESVGIGTTIGAAINKVVQVGVTTELVSIPCRSIYLPNHPFKTGQRLTFTKTTTPGVNSLIVGNDNLNTATFFIPNQTTLSSDVYVINKGTDFIGLTTQVGLTTSTEGLFFYSDGSDNAEYLLKTNKNQLIGNVDRITTVVGTSATHGLQKGDTVRLSVVPNTVVGFGTTAAVKLKLNLDEKKILVNTIGINSTSISLSDGSFTYIEHGYNTGDKVFYESTEVASGLSTGSYYVVKDTRDKFRLSETLYETRPDSEKTVRMTTTGGVNHNISAINPKIDVVRNGDLTFNLQDPSLLGYELKIYREREFVNEYNSSLDSRDFNVVGVGSVGIGSLSNATLTVKHSPSIPTKLYYGLSKGGYISTADTEVLNHSEINYVDSEYNGVYEVFGLSTTATSQFSVSPKIYPDVLEYDDEQCDEINYFTRSSTALNGSISQVRVLSKGFNFERLPKFKDVTSENGINANIIGVSTSIGRIKTTRFRDIGYDYASDRTLRPEAFVPPIVSIDNLDVIKNINIEFGGERYLSDPDLLLWNDTTKKVVDSTTLIARAPNGSISEIEQIAPIPGLQSEPHKIIAINNSNGVGIVSMVSGPTGIATCVLKTPILGYTSPQFAVNDRIFVEGIEMASPDGSGFNSQDYDYQMFKVIQYANTSPASLTFQLVDDAGVGLTTNAGIAKTFQSGYATLINESNYPRITIEQERGSFVENERLYVDSGQGYAKQDLFVALVRDDYIKVRGRANLFKGDRIKGFISGTIADVTSIDRKRGKFEIEYSSKNDIGWNDDIGKISQDYQVTPNNDYYQNLSYSIKSPITWDELSTPVNSIVHPAGLKNFADVGVSSEASSRIGLGGTTTAIVILDVVNERRVDIVNYFDNTLDDNPRVSSITGLTQSNALQIQNRKLTDFIECRTNRVLIHDDISEQFSSRGFKDTFLEIEEISFLDNHVRYLIQIVDPDTEDTQLSELVVQSTTNDIFLFEKYTTFTKNRLGSFEAEIQDGDRKVLKFIPADAFDTDYDIKVLKKTYLYQGLPAGSSGVGTESFGSVDLVSSFVGINSVTTGISSNTKVIAQFSDSDFNGLFASIEISNRFTSDTNYIEAAIDFDGTNTYVSEYYFDAQTLSYSASSVGIISAFHDTSAGIVSITAYNSSNEFIDVRSNIVGFANTVAGIGTYRFLLNNQPGGTEKSARYESVNGLGSNVVRAGTFDIRSISSAASIVRVSAGTTSAIHQVAIMANSRAGDIVVVPGTFSATNNVTGLGTFGGERVGNEFYLNFYPDAPYNVELQSFNEVFYREMDFDNQANPLSYGPTNKLLFLTAYDGLNGLRANRTNFAIKHDGKPIYMKEFDPSNTTLLNYASGLFTMQDHFFNTGEELLYNPKSTFIGVGQTAMGIGATANYAGVVTDRLPEKVYPIAITPDTFKLATTPQFARAGIFVTFTDAGLGNAHELEFTKKLSKSVIAIDGIVQQPVTFTPINHKLDHNGHYLTGGISAGISTFNISGISSIQPRDLLLVDDEFMSIVEVGFSTNVAGEVLGPISGVIASGAGVTFPTVSVKRGAVGTAATTHFDGANVQIYRGSFNIVKNELHFTDPPKGNNRARRNESNLPYVQAAFSGRTFLRSNYDTNMVFDDISDEFTGIGKTFSLKVGGADTTGVDSGNGILFINGVFQTPSTDNNAGNTYEFTRDVTAGISSVIYTGISSVDGTPIESKFDINQNQIPRGGLIVSLGSTPGLGYAPLVGAKVKAEKNSTGQITNIIGINTITTAVSISTALYNQISGILEIETTDSHNIRGGDRVKLDNLEFSCSSAHSGVTTTIFPDYDYPVDVFNVISATEVAINVGPSTIPHVYEGGGTVARHFTQNFGSGYRSPISIGVTDLAYEHRFVRSANNSITASTGGPFTPTNAKFTSHTGVLQLTIPNHGLDTTDTIQIATDSLVFTCSDDDFFTEQPYPRATDPAAGATLSVNAFTTNTISVGVGSAGGGGTGAVVEASVGIGGTLSFTITNPGKGYINPSIIIPEPNYENMEIVGVSRLGIGATTEVGKNLLLNLTVGSAGTSVGIGSTLFLIDEFKISRSGYGFQPGDVMEVVGLVTAKDFASPVDPFQLEVVETFNDKFSAWSFGEMDYIDSVFGFQNGSRKRFPLFYRGELLSFELDVNNPLSSAIDLDSVLVIFVNGVLQTPGYAYQFTGGTSFIFTEPPKANDKVDIFFYLGIDGVDVTQVETTETIKVGDEVFVRKHPNFNETADQLRERSITEITGSDIFETDIYSGPGVNDTIFRPFDWIKQKKDKFVKGDLISKKRPILETKVFPTARIIGDISPTSSEIFVDNAQFFDYDEMVLDLSQNTFTFDAFMMDSIEPVSAAFTATVSIAGTVSGVSIANPGVGYTVTSADIKFSAPKEIGVGIGTTATGTVTVSNGQVTSVSITNAGFGYTNTNPPQVIIETPRVASENISNVSNVQGFSGIITGISTSVGTNGHPLALKFNFRAMKDYGVDGEAEVASDALDLQVGYPVMIYNTTVGNGVTSVNSSDSAIVGIGTTFLDNVYIVNNITSLASKAEITCNVHSSSPIIGILESGNFDDNNAGLTTSLGTLSWGRIFNYDVRNGIGIGVTGLTVDAGLSTFPTIQRRGNFGEGKTGAVRSTKPRADGVSIEADNNLNFYIQ